MNDDDDPVIFETNVFFDEPDPAPPLYILQYPLTSASQSFPKTFEQARFKPKSERLELTVPLKTKSANYCKETGAKLAGLSFHAGGHEGRSQLLENYILSGGAAPQHTKYYVGTMRKEGLYLMPLKNTLQLKPSLQYLDEEKNEASSSGGGLFPPADARAVQMQFRKMETEEQLTARLKSYPYQLKQMMEEPWLYLPCYPADSNESTKFANELVQRVDEIQKSRMMTTVLPATDSYLEQVFGVAIGTSARPASFQPDTQHEAGTIKMPKSMISLHELLDKSLHDQVHTLMSNARILSFSRLYELIKSPIKTESLVLDEVTQIAFLICGAWIIKSDLVHTDPNNIHFRNVLLNQFKSQRHIRRKEYIDQAKTSPDLATSLLKEIAKLVPGNGWMLKVAYDECFCNRYPALVETQEALFQKELKRSADQLSTPLSSKGKPGKAMTSKPASFEPKKKLADEAFAKCQSPLDSLLLQLFHEYHVLDFSSICHLVRQKFPSTEDASILSSLQSIQAVEMHQSWTLSTLHDEQLDKYRSIILSLFSQKPALKRSEILSAIEEKLHESIPNALYTRIIKELAVSKGVQWVFKSGFLAALD